LFNFTFNFNSDNIHTIHPYPAKFPPSVPHQLLQELSKPGDVVLDPFCGSGTTLSEALSFNCHAIGNDINFIALLISRVKTTNYNDMDFQCIENKIKQIQDNYESKIKIKNVTNFKGIEHWFQENVRYELDVIKDVINSIENKKQKELLQLVFSRIIIDVSNQDSDTRYAAINKSIKDGDTLEKFLKQYTLIKDKVATTQYNTDLNINILNEDARILNSIQDETIDIIITSPPYANTYDYYLYHKHRMNWLGYDFNISKKQEIGSRNEYSSKKKPIEKWISDIEDFMLTMKRVTKANGYICIIIGDSVVNKIFFNAREVVEQIAEKIDLDLVFSTSISLSKNSKKFNHKFRTKYDKQEHVIILRK
jgi:site-specific DNA-methyltransferase (cytosine-N4-specific)